MDYGRIGKCAWVLSLVALLCAVTPGLSQSDAQRPSDGDLRSLHDGAVAAVTKRLGGATSGGAEGGSDQAGPTEFHLDMADALVHHAVSAQLDPTGVRLEDGFVHAFRVGEAWSRARLGTTSERLSRRLDVSQLDLSKLKWDGTHLSGSIASEVARFNPRRDTGEGENMHSMLKAQRRGVMNWDVGGIERTRPQPHRFDIDAKVEKGKLALYLRLVGFAGEARAAEPPNPDDTTKIRPRDADQRLGRRRVTLLMQLEWRNGHWLSSEARTPGWNRALHDVDPEELKLEGDRLHGTVKVTLMPDPWVPGADKSGKRTRSITCSVDARIAFGSVTGKYQASGDQGDYADELRGTVWQALSGTFRTKSIDGEHEGRLTVRMRHLPASVKQIAGLHPSPFSQRVGPKLPDGVRESIDTYRGLHAALLTRLHLPIAPEESFEESTAMPVPVFADEAAREAYLAELRRFAKAASALVEAGVKPAVGNVTPPDAQFGPYLGQEAMSGDALPETFSKPGPQTWSMPQQWQALGPLERQGRGGWYESLLPAVVPARSVSYALPRPKLSETITITRSWQPVRPRGSAVQPDDESYRDSFPSQRSYSGYGSYAANMIYHLEQNSNRSHRWYATTTLRSPRDGALWLAIQARDDGRLWVNGQLAWEAGPDYDPGAVAVFRVEVRKGENELLVESGNRRIHYSPPSDWNRSRFSLWVCTKGLPRTVEEVAAARQSQGDAYAKASKQIDGYHAPHARRYLDAQPPMTCELEDDRNVVWRSSMPDAAGPMVLDGKQLLVPIEPHHLVSLNADTGKEKWRVTCDVFAAPKDSDKPSMLDQLRAALAEQRELEKVYREAHRAWRNAKENGDRERLIHATTKRNKAAARLKAHEAKWEPVRKQLEKQGVGLRSDRLGSRAGAAPIVRGQHIFVTFGTGVAACISPSGEKQWQTTTGLTWTGGDEYSPLLCGEQLIVYGTVEPPDGQKERPHVVMSLDAATGKEQWRSEALSVPAGLVAVPLGTSEGKPRFALVTPDCTVIDGRDGRVLFRRQFTLASPITPVVKDNVAYCVGKNLGQAAFRFWMDEQGRIGSRRMWEIRRAGSSSPQVSAAGLVEDGLIYIPRSSDENAGHHPVPWDQLDVYDAALGQHLARPNPVVYTSASPLPLVRAGQFMVVCDSGTRGYGQTKPEATLAYVTRGDRAYLLNRLSLGTRKLRSTPVFAGRRMYARLDGEVVCIGTGQQADLELDETAVARNILGLVGRQSYDKTMEIKPIDGFDPPDVVPVVELAANVPPDRWLMSTPLPLIEGASAKGIGDVKSFVPRPGSKITVGNATATFGKPPAKVLPMRSMTMVFRSDGTYYQPTHGIDAGEAVGGKQRRSVYFYTVLRVSRKMHMNLRVSNGNAWLAGEYVGSQRALSLERGYYPMLVRVDVGLIPPVGRIVVVPRFSPIIAPEKSTADWLGRIRRYQDRLKWIKVTFSGQGLGLHAKRLLDALKKAESSHPGQTIKG